MKINRKFQGGILVTIGYILSPLSWWNDVVINLPIAYFFAAIFSLINKVLFLPTMVIAYLATNIVGFLMIHYGTTDILGHKNRITKKSTIKIIAVSLVYTAIIIILIQFNWLKISWEYFI